MDEIEREMAAEERAVIELGEKIGYGRLMQLAEECWRKKLESIGDTSGNEFIVGPCAGDVVPCQCAGSEQVGPLCEWCGGTERLTYRVREAQLDALPAPKAAQPPLRLVTTDDGAER